MPENLKLSPVRCTHADVRCSWGRASYIRRSSQTRNTYTQLVKLLVPYNQQLLDLPPRVVVVGRGRGGVHTPRQP
jgi:hypothetical protein